MSNLTSIYGYDLVGSLHLEESKAASTNNKNDAFDYTALFGETVTPPPLPQKTITPPPLPQQTHTLRAAQESSDSPTTTEEHEAASTNNKNDEIDYTAFFGGTITPPPLPQQTHILPASQESSDSPTTTDDSSAEIREPAQPKRKTSTNTNWLTFIVGLHPKNTEEATSLIEEDPQNYFKLSLEYQNKPEIIFSLLKQDHTLYHKLASSLQSNENVQHFRTIAEAIAAVNHKNIDLATCSEETRNNEEIVKIAVTQSPVNLLHVGQNIKTDQEKYKNLILIAAKRNPIELLTKVKTKEVLEDEKVLHTCCHNPEAYKYLPEKFKNNEAFCLKIVTDINGKVWSKLPSKFQNKLEFATAAIDQTKENPFNTDKIANLPEPLHKNEAICRRIVNTNEGKYFWEDVPELYRLDTAFVNSLEVNISRKLQNRLCMERAKIQKEILDWIKPNSLNIFINQNTTTLRSAHPRFHEMLPVLMKDDLTFCVKCLDAHRLLGTLYLPEHLRGNPEISPKLYRP